MKKIENTADLNEVYDKYKEHFVGGFHNMLWQLFINNRFKQYEKKGFVLAIDKADPGAYQLGLGIYEECGYYNLNVQFKKRMGSEVYFELAKIIVDLNRDCFGLMPEESLRIGLSTLKIGG